MHGGWRCLSSPLSFFAGGFCCCGGGHGEKSFLFLADRFCDSGIFLLLLLYPLGLYRISPSGHIFGKRGWDLFYFHQEASLSSVISFTFFPLWNIVLKSPEITVGKMEIHELEILSFILNLQNNLQSLVVYARIVFVREPTFPSNLAFF